MLGACSPIGSDQVDGAPLEIAVANSFEGANTASRRAVLRAAEMLALEVNAAGGIGGRPLLLEPIEDQLAAGGAEAVLLIVRPTQAEPLVQQLRRRAVMSLLMGTDSPALAGFAAERSAERADAGPHITDGMSIAVPFILDTATAAARPFLADHAARHGEDPSWGSAMPMPAR